MAGIININNGYHLNSERIMSKLSFEIGEIFLAKIVNMDELTNELLIKMLDGWQFSAKLQTPLNFSPQGLVRFQVQGFEEGKLVLKMVNNLKLKDEEYSSIKNTLNEQNISSDKKDYQLFKSMIKHGMPLTKENIADVKNIVDFKMKIISEPEEKNKFINKYLESKNIDVTSKEGKQISNILKGFFNELEKLSMDELLTMKENFIELTEDNIKSFKKLFKENSNTSIYKELNEVQNKTLKSDGQNNGDKASITQNKNMSKNETVKQLNVIKDVANKNVSEKNQMVMKDSFINSMVEDIVPNNKINNDESIQNKTETNTSLQSKSEIDENLENSQKPEGKVSQSKIDIVEEKRNNASEIVKNEIHKKTEEMKENIKNLLDKIEAKLSMDKDDFNNIASALKEKINDFKVFNSVSNQYYYLDIPLNKESLDYQCKLIIKDERKNGKIIDSKSVKMVVSVKTLNMGMIDAYIHVKEENMNIEMKCDKIWTAILNSKSDDIIRKLSNLKYNVFVSVGIKEKEADLMNCREFFEDSTINGINVKV